MWQSLLVLHPGPGMPSRMSMLPTAPAPPNVAPQCQGEHCRTCVTNGDTGLEECNSCEGGPSHGDGLCRTV